MVLWHPTKLMKGFCFHSLFNPCYSHILHTLFKAIHPRILRRSLSAMFRSRYLRAEPGVVAHDLAAGGVHSGWGTH